MMLRAGGSHGGHHCYSRLLEQFRQQVERERLLTTLPAKSVAPAAPEKILSVLQMNSARY